MDDWEDATVTVICHSEAEYYIENFLQAEALKRPAINCKAIPPEGLPLQYIPVIIITLEDDWM
jgi:hypothetical protein